MLPDRSLTTNSACNKPEPQDFWGHKERKAAGCIVPKEPRFVARFAREHTP